MEVSLHIPKDSMLSSWLSQTLCPTTGEGSEVSSAEWSLIQLLRVDTLWTPVQNPSETFTTLRIYFPCGHSSLTALETHSWAEWLVTIFVLLVGHSAVFCPTVPVTYCMSRSITSILTFNRLLQSFRLVGFLKFFCWHILGKREKPLDCILLVPPKLLESKISEQLKTKIISLSQNM